ncbi:hypothetical protein EDD22DRAFT_956580 [Suillus occidentalis]|nr:hypothetical protein EDD22DRAFT_956580 [Suillus occidentalis]
MTDNYSQWSTYHVKGKKTSKCIKAEPDEHNELKAEHMMNTNEAIPDTLQHSSLDCEPTPPPSTDKGKGKEVPIVEVKNPLSNLVMKPRPRPLSSKPMCVSPKITAWNLCALEWQSNGHQKELASVFAAYWNRLPTADKELYKHKAAVQLASSAQAQIDNNHDQ